MPRSPSRDLSDRFMGGPRTYFRGWNVVERWKLWLSAVAVALVAGWAVASFGWKRETETQLTHGPLTESHATWEAKCEVCHRPPSGGTLDAFANWNSFTCETCHAAPQHYATVEGRPYLVDTNCGSCHHDHQGRANSLVRMADSHCTKCHNTDLPGHHNHGTNPVGQATNFVTDHPEFQPLAKRASSLKFSHGLHMTAGIVRTEGAKGAWTNERGAVTLECTSCHQADGPAGAEGRHFKPISFDRHCKACHPNSTGPVVTQFNSVMKSFDVPHGKQLGELKPIIEGGYAIKLQEVHDVLASPTSPFDPKRKDDASVKRYQDDVNNSTNTAVEFLTMTCLKCHETTSPLMMKPSAIPAVLLSHAKFDHVAHRASDCKSCHPNTVARFVNGDPNYEREPVNIRGIESCRTCHAPKVGDIGGIRHGCTDCHLFHGHDALDKMPPVGRADPHRAPKALLTFEEFLRGESKPKPEAGGVAPNP